MKLLLRTCLAVSLLCPFLAAQQANNNSAPPILTGSVELGVALALTSVDGNAAVTVGLNSAYFLMETGPLQVATGVELGFQHRNSFNQLDMLGLLTFETPVGRSTSQVFGGLGAGIRQEWLGSFRQARYPLGLSLGWRSMLGNRAGFRTEYSLRRFTNDPFSDFTEHRITVGMSFFFRNKR